MIVLKLGNLLACVCDRCQVAYRGNYADSLLKEFRLTEPLVCRECAAVLEQQEKYKGKMVPGIEAEHVKAPLDGQNQGQAP